MIDFETELSKFQMSLEVDQIEEAVYHNDLSDVTDIMKDLLEQVKNK